MIKKISITLTALVLMASCHKNDSPVGVDILPNTDQLGAAYAEILPTVSYSKFDDSTRTSNLTSSNLLGSVNDPVFGRTDASIYSTFESQYSIPCNTGALGVNPVLDSAVLCLIYNTSVAFIGDTTQPLTIDVFPITQRIYRDSIYYSDRNIPYNKNASMIEGGSKVFYPHLKTHYKINKDDAAPSAFPQLRLRLRKEFGEMLFNSSYLCSYTNLQNAFNGLFISTNNSVLAQPSYGSIFYVDMNLTSIKLYYH